MIAVDKTMEIWKGNQELAMTRLCSLMHSNHGCGAKEKKSLRGSSYLKHIKRLQNKTYQH